MEEAQEFTPASQKLYDRIGFGAVLAVFGGLTLWSISAPIDGAVIAGGQVVVESNRKTVQHLEGGVVGTIEVREGDLVQEGDVVARLDDTVQQANTSLIDSQLTELYARRARLEAERDRSESMGASRGVDDVLQSPAFAVTLAGQSQLFEARRTTRKTQISLLDERVTQQNERIGGLNAQITSMRAQLRLINEELGSVEELHAQGYAPKTRLMELQRESKRLGGERGALSAGVAEALSVISEAKLEIERLRETGREEAITELRDAEVTIAELEERRITAIDALRRTEIRAPQSGRVLALSIHTIGGVVAPGAPLMEIVPDGDRLQVAARVAPQDVDKVRPGQETLVRFSAFGSRRTPEALGDVRTVSADAMMDQGTGLQYFLVVVDIPEDQALDDLLSGERLVPGMPVEAFIQTGSQPAINYLLKPLTDSFARSLKEE